MNPEQSVNCMHGRLEDHDAVNTQHSPFDLHESGVDPAVVSSSSFWQGESSGYDGWLVPDAETARWADYTFPSDRMSAATHTPFTAYDYSTLDDISRVSISRTFLTVSRLTHMLRSMRSRWALMVAPEPQETTFLQTGLIMHRRLLAKGVIGLEVLRMRQPLILIW